MGWGFSTLYKIVLLVTVVDRSVFARWDAVIVGSNPTSCVDVWCVCVRACARAFFCVCVVPYLGRDLKKGR
jgi:hypothetical protein